VRRPQAPALAHESSAPTVVLCASCAAATLLALLAIAAVAAHWWSLVGDAWTIAVAWGLFAGAAGLLLVPDVQSERCDAWERSAGVVGLLGAIVATLAFLVYPIIGLRFGIAPVALVDAVAIAGALAFIVGSGRRLATLSEWTGFDRSDAPFMVQNGPLFLGIFLVGIAYLLTHFFRRGLDAADAFAVAIGAWIVWRSSAVAWHAAEALSSRSVLAARAERDRLKGPSGSPPSGSRGPAP
jgi:hypothetical protein